MAKDKNILFIILAIILVVFILNNQMDLGLFAVFEPSECREEEYSQSFVSYNADGYKYTQLLTAQAKICYPRTLPAYPTEGDVIKLTCTGTSLYIDTDSSTCNEHGCGGTKVTKTYNYTIKPGQTDLKAVCWNKKTDENAADEKIWVWVPAEVQFSFDGINPLVVVPPVVTAVCGDDKCDPGETCLTCKDCEPYLRILSGPRVYQGCGNETLCGDGVCDESQGEACDKCWPDCGNCPEPEGGWWCGDGKCESEETAATCPEDCSVAPTCTPETTQACNVGNCVGTKTCNTNGAWGSCNKEDIGCGVINPNFCSIFDFIEPAFGANSCIVGTIAGIIILLILFRALLK